MNQTQQGGSEPKTGAVAPGAPLLVLKKLDKRFGAAHALKAVDLVFEAGEIHAIVGLKGRSPGPCPKGKGAGGLSTGFSTGLNGAKIRRGWRWFLPGKGRWDSARFHPRTPTQAGSLYYIALRSVE